MKLFLIFILTPLVYSSKNSSTPVFSGCGLQVARCEEVSKQEENLCNPNARIVGGGESFKGEFPWMALLFMRDTRHQFCAGTLLDEKHILTANHCVFDFDPIAITRLRVILGDHNIHTLRDGIHVERRVSKIFKHPKWSRKTNENDIAIIRMQRPVQFSTFIQPICLPTISLKELTKLYEKEHEILATIVGWGRTSADPNITKKSSVPLKAIIPLEDHQQCQKDYKPYTVTRNMICAGGNGKDACIADSGGILQIKNRHSMRWEQIGIISWGNSCKTLPGIYTRVENYLDWIFSVIKKP